MLPVLLAVKPEAAGLVLPAPKAETEGAAALTPDVLNAARLFELVIEKAFLVPLSLLTISARPPPPVVSTVDA